MINNPESLGEVGDRCARGVITGTAVHVGVRERLARLSERRWPLESITCSLQVID